MPKLKLIKPVIDNSHNFCGYKGGPIGWWEVTTEGDCEGRSTRELGVHFGHIAEISFGLDASACFSYSFNPVKDKEPLKDYNPWIIRRKSCHVQLWVESWDRVKTSKGIEDLVRWFDTNDISVKLSNYFGCFHISLKESK